MGLSWDFWDFLLRERDADGDDVALVAQGGDGLVVIALAIANAVAPSVKAKERDEEDIGGGCGAGWDGFEEAHFVGGEMANVTGIAKMKGKRLSPSPLPE